MEGGEPVADLKQAEIGRHLRTFPTQYKPAFFKAFDRIPDISKYIKIRKELIKMDNISCDDVRRPSCQKMQPIDIDGVV
jgi:hypothetical protein